MEFSFYFPVKLIVGQSVAGALPAVKGQALPAYDPRELPTMPWDCAPFCWDRRGAGPG
jgi:hypothetical protein